MQPASVTEKHRSVLINFFYYALILGAAYLFLRFAFWPLFPFMLAFFVAMMLQKPVNFITKKTPLKRGLVSLICVLLILAIVISLVTLIGTTVFTKVKDFVTDLMSNFESLPNFIRQAEKWLLGLTEKLPASVQTALQNNIEKLADNLLVSFSDTEQQLTQNADGAGFDFSVLKTPPRERVATETRILRDSDAIVKSAIDQIRDKRYPARLENYAGNILCVGIGYKKTDSKNPGYKKHTCVIEKM